MMYGPGGNPGEDEQRGGTAEEHLTAFSVDKVLRLPKAGT